ncbi:IS66 family transposase [Vibrio vulnificus]|uniref:IS66 family transposase n=1 Tax=Vibrio vulnificus TaxID=672 RepID=UPI00165D3595
MDRHSVNHDLLLKVELCCRKLTLDKSATQVLPKSKLGVAINYSLNQWEKLRRVVDDGRLSLDNNRAERSVRPFTVGRN